MDLYPSLLESGQGSGEDGSGSDRWGGCDAFQVVCTPSGGAQSVRIELPGDCERTLDRIWARLDQAR
jgi:hypothetical protein